jgi:hypothetical protein
VFPENFEQVRALLSDFLAESAIIFSAPPLLPPYPTYPCRQIGHDEIAPLQHLPADLLGELLDVADAGCPVAAAFDGTLPVSFCYVASETHALWDVSIDTIATHRRKGFAAAAAIHLMYLMKQRGKTAVWGALASNLASRNLALRLGFVEVDRIWVFVRSTTQHPPQ